MLPYKPLYEDEREALWLMVKGHTIDGIAEILNSQFGLTHRQAKRRIETAIWKLGASKATEAVAKAIASGIVPREKVAHYYGIPTYQFNGYLPILTDVSNPNEVNEWLLEDVIRGQPGSRDNLDELNSYFSQTLNRVRQYASTYPAHPPSRVSLPFIEALTLGYQGKGPRIVGKKGLPQKAWPKETFEELLCPIIATGDERAALAASILENYQQTFDAFHQQMKRGKWLYLDIVPMSALHELVTKRALTRDTSLKYLGVKELTKDQVWNSLSYAVDILDSFETYHIALLDDISDPNDGLVQLLSQHIKEHFWTIKPGVDGQLSLILTEWLAQQQGKRLEVHCYIDDWEITKAFIEIIGFLWRNMPANKLLTDKQAVIDYLNEQRAEIPTSRK
jgi:hypothetical protein